MYGIPRCRELDVAEGDGVADGDCVALGDAPGDSVDVGVTVDDGVAEGERPTCWGERRRNGSAGHAAERGGARHAKRQGDGGGGYVGLGGET